MTAGDSTIKRSGSSPFRARARLIRMLGEELISNEEMALAELVKNAYDADAHHVLISFDGLSDANTGVIRIQDDGYGMDLHTVLHSWLEPATPHKRTHGGKVRTQLGRIQLGEKGVGRFAADKLGSELELVSRAPDAEEEVVLRVGWHDFDHDSYLDEVANSWFTRDPVEFPGHGHGTVLVIRSLRTNWNAEMVTQAHNALMRLVSPRTTAIDFVIELDCPEFPQASGRVANQLLETAPYRLAGKVDVTGNFIVDDGSGRCVDLRPIAHDHFLTSSDELRQPLCGPFSVSLNIWDLEPATKSGFGVARTLREAVKATSGVSIYRDGFRIWPYGEKDDDWLELNQRRVNNPTLRVSNNQIIGFVEITHANNPDLRDRTSREGLLDTPALFDLKALVVAALTDLETQRFARRRLSDSSLQPTPAQEEDELLQCIARVRTASAISGEDQLRPALQEMERLYRQRLEEEQTRYNQVSRLAGMGMAAEILTDAFTREITNATTLLRILKGELGSDTNPRIQELLNALTGRMNSIDAQLDMMGPLYRASSSDVDSADVRGIVSDVLSLFAGRIAETSTKISQTGPKSLSVRINRGHLMQVLVILIENALSVMSQNSVTSPQLEIRVIVGKEFNGIQVSDNGPGVPAAVRNLIFRPYFSTRQAGRGLGLHVARDILSSYNSTIQLVTEQAPLPGACFEIRFDGRRVVSKSGQT